MGQVDYNMVINQEDRMTPEVLKDAIFFSFWIMLGFIYFFLRQEDRMKIKLGYITIKKNKWGETISLAKKDGKAKKITMIIE